ncbi:MAG: FHA domain-containing protein [Candidatus Schekmanbacteria bacterium]|nr:FHA domain-containing protein [Candidatus Schekmanbacteria bacterium]
MAGLPGERCKYCGGPLSAGATANVRPTITCPGCGGLNVAPRLGDSSTPPDSAAVPPPTAADSQRARPRRPAARLAGPCGERDLALPKDRRFSLTVLEGPLQGRKIPFTKPSILLGRLGVDISLEDSAASASHAVIELFGGQAVLRDLGSSNGTYVNGKRVEQAILASMDEIRIGRSLLIFSSVDAALESIASGADEAETHPHLLLPPAGMAADADGKQTRLRVDLPPGSNAPAPLQIELQFVSGPWQGRTIPVMVRATTIGRTAGHLRIPDADVSRKHAQLEFNRDDALYVKDLDSTNGTFVNGKRVSVAPIKDGDSVRVGSSTFRVKM